MPTGKQNGSYIHGLSESGTFRSWASMITRCTNTKVPSYQRYGARGVKVCDRWKSFSNFLSDMGERPQGTSLDRIDNDGNYELGNCRWATSAQQNNNSSHNRRITIDGVTKTIEDWSRHSGIEQSTLSHRYKRGWAGAKFISPLRRNQFR